jgi:hypothetical protein
MARRRRLSLFIGGLLAIAAALVAVSGTAVSVRAATSTPDPLPGVDVTCGKITFTATMADPGNWEAIVEPGDHLVGPFTAGANVLDLAPGGYSFEIRQWNTPVGGVWNDVTGSQFTVFACASPTTFQSVQGETASARRTSSLPPTSTASSPSDGSSTPLYALLICVAFGGLGLAAVEAQRRTIRR